MQLHTLLLIVLIVIPCNGRYHNTIVQQNQRGNMLPAYFVTNVLRPAKTPHVTELRTHVTKQQSPYNQQHKPKDIGTPHQQRKAIQERNNNAAKPKPHSKGLHFRAHKVYSAEGERKYQYMATGYNEYVAGQPAPGMIDAMKGYHLFEGDPVNENPDHGVRYPLFEIGPKNISTGKYTKIYDVYTVTPFPGCDVDYNADTSWTLNDYLKHTSSSFFIGGDLDLPLDKLKGRGKTPLPFSIYGSGHFNIEKENLKKLFVNEHGAVTMIHATCFFYQVQIADLNVPLKFDIGFQNALKDSYHKSTNNGDPPADGAVTLKKMFDTYGTHYSANTFLGSKIVAQRRLTGYQRRLLSEDELNMCGHLGGGLKQTGEGILSKIKGNLEGSANISGCYNTTEVLKANQTVSIEHWSYTTYGSEKKDSVEEWTHQIVRYPYAVKRVLRPWVELLDNVRSLMAIDECMNNTKRLSWMKEMY